MGHNTHEDVARRWVNRIMHPGRPALNSNNLLDWGERIMSYGSHFEVARILRNRKGEPITWLLNGNTYSVTTTRHQNEVRSAVSGTGLPMLTIPHAALDAAGIDIRTIELVDVQSDWWTEKVITKDHLVGSWRTELSYYPGGDYGGWVNTRTNEFVPKTQRWGETPPQIGCDHEIVAPGPWKMGYNYERDYRTRQLREVHLRARHGAWEEVRPHHRDTGRKVAQMSTHIDWELVDAPDAPLGYAFQRTVRRHWLGASLIKAQVPYIVQVKHAECGGTGVADEPWFSYGQPVGIGPLTEDQMRIAERQSDFIMERNGGIRQPFNWMTMRMIDVMIENTECRGCGGRGRTTATRVRRAYFLSGFDENETRPSYFFCELPPKAHPTTVEEALEALKPSAVKLAEQMGREVKRQGDIFAIPMPGLTLRELKAQGGVHIRTPRLIVPSTGGRWTDELDSGAEAPVWSGPRPQLLGTNHEATEIVLVNGQTYARGTIKHVPEFRRPDHRPTPLGKEWHLIQKNTVPVGS